MSTEKVVFNKLFKGKKEISLSIKNDLENIFNELSFADSGDADFDNVVEKAIDFDAKLMQAREAGREFANANEILQSKYDQLDNLIQQADAKIAEYQNALRELGLDDMTPETEEYIDKLDQYYKIDSKVFNYNNEQEKFTGGTDFISLMSWVRDLEK
jgi:DNA repair exonuclease SbcCD ATPase subunit